jgi:hypothetical protein
MQLESFGDVHERPLIGSICRSFITRDAIVEDARAVPSVHARLVNNFLSRKFVMVLALEDMIMKV